MINNAHRVGRVSTINEAEHTATVYFDDIEYMSAPLSIIKNVPKVKNPDGEFFEVVPWMPVVGETVVCAFLDDSSDGFILGTYD